MKKKLLGTAIIAALTSGCGILETLETVEVPRLRFDSNSYVVQPGDTLGSVASRYKIDPDSLLNVNSLELAELIPGQRLVLLRDEEVTSLAEIANRRRASTNIATETGTLLSSKAIGGGEAGVVVSDPMPLSEPGLISADVILPAQGQEEIIGVVNVDDALLDKQPVFVGDAAAVSPLSVPPVAAVAVDRLPVRPQGVETIVQTINVEDPVAPVIPAAATVDIADANSATANKRVTVNTRAQGWNWPVLGTITQDFDLREINRQGLDIDPGADAAVQAASDGQVVYSGRDLASYGNLVILRHENNFLSAYSKVSEIFVDENQKVKAGDVIASVGKNDAGEHEMHFEIRQNGEPVNPIDYLPAL